MGIQISGVNGVDKIVATDGTIDVLSGANHSGVVTATSFSGNLTGNVTGDVVGNLTGNVNHTSNLLLQINGSEKFRVGTSGQLGIGGGNYGTSGQALVSAGSGAPPTWNTIEGTTINNNADNRIITGSGTANTLNGESSLTFDGNDLVVSGANVSEIKIDSDGGGFLAAGGSAIVVKGYFDYSGSVTGLYTNNAGQGVIGTKTNQEFHFIINNTKQLAITQNGYLVPETNNQDLGTSSNRWRNLYVNDLKLSNESKKDTGGNDVDGTWGNYTIQEGESDLFLINNRNGKKYQFLLKEVS